VPKIRANGIDLYYEIKGAGEPLLLIGGFGCDHTIWSQVAGAFSSRYAAISFDNRGMGQSSPSAAPYSIRDLADDAGALLDVLGIEQAHVAAHSMGGQIAQELALARSNRVRSLLLLSSCAKCDERNQSLIAEHGKLPASADIKTCALLIMPWLYTNAFYSRPGAIEDLLDWILKYPFPPAAVELERQSHAIIAFDARDRIGGIECPTLVLVGEEDVMIPPLFSRNLAKSIPNAELQILPGTGHGFLVESPATVAGVMLDFLSKYTITKARK
jgi:pimeloyl-ACP methyl ester carboxylesterase